MLFAWLVWQKLPNARFVEKVLCTWIEWVSPVFGTKFYLWCSHFETVRKSSRHPSQDLIRGFFYSHHDFLWWFLFFSPFPRLALTEEALLERKTSVSREQKALVAMLVSRSFGVRVTAHFRAPSRRCVAACKSLFERYWLIWNSIARQGLLVAGEGEADQDAELEGILICTTSTWSMEKSKNSTSTSDPVFLLGIELNRWPAMPEYTCECEESTLKSSSSKRMRTRSPASVFFTHILISLFSTYLVDQPERQQSRSRWHSTHQQNPSYASSTRTENLMERDDFCYC